MWIHILLDFGRTQQVMIHLTPMMSSHDSRLKGGGVGGGSLLLLKVALTMITTM